MPSTSVASTLSTVDRGRHRPGMERNAADGPGTTSSACFDDRACRTDLDGRKVAAARPCVGQGQRGARVVLPHRRQVRIGVGQPPRRVEQRPRQSARGGTDLGPSGRPAELVRPLTTTWWRRVLEGGLPDADGDLARHAVDDCRYHAAGAIGIDAQTNAKNIFNDHRTDLGRRYRVVAIRGPRGTTAYLRQNASAIVEVAVATSGT